MERNAPARNVAFRKDVEHGRRRDPERMYGERMRNRRQADIRKGVERVRQVERLLRDKWHGMDPGLAARVTPLICKRRQLPPLSEGTPRSDQYPGTTAANSHGFSTDRSVHFSRQVAEASGRSRQGTKRTKNMYSQKAAFFYEGQVSRLRMPVWRPLPSLKERSNRRKPAPEPAPGGDDSTVHGLDADYGMTAGYAYKYSFPPASNRTPQNTPRQLGMPLGTREATVDFLSRVDRLLASKEGIPPTEPGSEALSSAHTSDIEANLDDVSGQVSCDVANLKAVPKEDDVSYDFLKLEGLVSGVYQRKPVDVKRKCLVWVNRHRTIKGYSLE